MTLIWSCEVHGRWVEIKPKALIITLLLKPLSDSARIFYNFVTKFLIKSGFKSDCLLLNSQSYLFQLKFFQNDDKCFSFHVKQSLCSQDSLNFFANVFGYVGKRLYQKAKVIFKISDVIDWEVIITIHILCNISRSRGNQAIRLGQLIEYEKYHSWKKTYTKNGGEESSI